MAHLTAGTTGVAHRGTAATGGDRVLCRVTPGVLSSFPAGPITPPNPQSALVDEENIFSPLGSPGMASCRG